jgi:hypothetical protein
MPYALPIVRFLVIAAAARTSAITIIIMTGAVTNGTSTLSTK